jgi:hypothetical protein
MSVTDYASADAYLLSRRTARTKLDSKIAHNTRLVRGLVSPDSISVVYHATPIVTYWSDGTLTVWVNDWPTTTTSARVGTYAPITRKGGYLSMSYEKELTWIPVKGPRTPSKIQKCRTCKGKGGESRDHHCGGPSWWDACKGPTTEHSVAYTGKNWDEYFASRYEVPCEHGEEFTGRHYTTPCEHGQMSSHVYGEPYWSGCYRCDGTGKADYGNKPIATQFGSQARLHFSRDENEDVVVTVAEWGGKYHVSTTYSGGSSYVPKKYGVTPAAHYYKGSVQQPELDYSDSGDVLEQALPGLAKYVITPCECEGRYPVKDAIIHLNDRHRWTRDQIADWLETLDVNLAFQSTSTTKEEGEAA